MKKSVIIIVVGLLLSIAAFARIIVLQDGKTTSYKSEEKVVIDGKTPASILFDGVLIKVPANKKKVTIKKQGEEINISGANLNNIEIAGKKVTANGQTTVAFSPETKEITVIKGELVNTDTGVTKNTVQKTGQTTSVKSVAKPASVTPVINETVEFPEVSNYVNEVTSQQTVQDVEDLSQSSPRS